MTGKTAAPVAVVGDIASKYFSSVRTRTAIEPAGRYLKKPKLDCVPKILEMDYSKILNKPYFIENITWDNTSVAGDYIKILNIPEQILTNPLVKIPFEASVYYRAKISVVLQVAGTPMHSGILLASALPVGGDTAFQHQNLQSTNKLLAAPHVFLSANEATPVILEVPFYINSKLAPVVLPGDETSVVPGSRTGNYSNVVIMVMNPLGTPTSGSTSLTVTAHFIFDDIEFYVPHVSPTWVTPTPTFVAEGVFDSAKGFVTDVFDKTQSGLKSNVDGIYNTIAGSKTIMYDFIDSGRGWLRSLTGLHNPSDATISTKVATQLRQHANVVDAPMQIEKLDPYSQFNHITRDYTFDTEIDEMLISEIVSKPQYIGTFSASTATTAGTLLYSRPITPFQEVNPTTYTGLDGQLVATIQMTSLLQTLHYLSRYWRGSLKIHIQSAMSNFHFCKLTVARNYSPDNRMITSYPSFTSVPNLMMETLEFVGHQVHTIDMPYCSLLEQLPCTTDPLLNSLQHGMYYVYMHQPLVTNGSVTTDVKFNVYVSAGPDFQLFGYASRPALMRYELLGVPLRSREGGLAITEEDEEAEFHPDFFAESEVLTQDALLLDKHEEQAENVTDLRPIVSVRDYLRRMNRVFYRRLLPSELVGFRGAYAIDLASLLGIASPKVEYPITNRHPCLGASPQKIINSMFLGYSGGIRLKIGTVGTTLGEVYYVPPGYHINAINGGNNNRAWESTSVFPTPVTAPPGGNYLENFLAPFQFSETTTNTFNSSYMISPLPLQERPNYIMSSAEQDTNGDATPGLNRLAMTTSVFEVEVPHMNPFRFVGDASKGYLPQTGTYSVNTAATGMGTLLLKLAQPFVYEPGVSTIQQDLAIEIFASVDDVGRSGYQVFAPTVVIPAVRLTQGVATSFYQIGTDSIRNPATTSVYPSYVSTFQSPLGPITPAFDYTRTLYYTAST